MEKAGLIETPVQTSNPIDWDSVRGEFPILNEEVHGKPLIYFDNAASSQKPEKVIRSIQEYYSHSNANVHRGIHELSNRATSIYENARTRLSEVIHASSASEIIFTRGTTEAINLVAYAWGWDNLKKGDRICLTEMEHHSNIVPWQMMAQRIGFEISYVPVTGRDGLLDLEAFEKILKSGVKFAAFTHVSNTLGTINPVKEMCRMASDAGIVTLVDGAQSGGHIPVDVVDIGCDFYAMSAHKACGPTGIGILYGKSAHLEKMSPFNGGGEMITQVTFDGSEFNVPPHRFEAGTPNVCGAAGYHAAMDFLGSIGIKAIADRDSQLVEYGMEKFSEIPGIEIFGPAGERGPVISFCVDGVHSHDLVTFADAKGLALRSGHHCNQPLMSRLGVSSTARASFYFYNTPSEIDKAAEILTKTCKFLAGS